MVEEEKNEPLKQALEELKYLSGAPDFQRMVESREKFIRDQVQREMDSEQRGREEEKIEIAKKLLKMKLSIEQIIQATGLSEKEIEELK